MSEYSNIRVNKLSFKGDKPKKKKPKKEKSSSKSHRTKRPDESEIDANPTTTEGWVPVEELDDLDGPITILFNSDPVRFLAVHRDTRCLRGAETTDSTESPKEPQSEKVTLHNAEPSDVSQVFMVRRVRNTGSAGRRPYTFKSNDGKYLSCDAAGDVAVDQVAIGPCELWTPIVRPDGISLQNADGRFLTLAFDSRNESLPQPITTHCRADQIGFCQVFTFKCQAQLKQKRTGTDPALNTSIGDYQEFELDEVKKYQSWTSGHLYRSQNGDGDRQLKRARREGRMAEALLDRREKLKSDKFCK
ncbi:FRG1-like family-domain-containing protein [Dimargaris cristalligena]|uniref:FRG1-like family-domain-containing protein n=1 Tax=Dimargaris cristalligena TaxID=215637 RepID=A0A4P9ZVU5_9FUNG|nr:FRG1-like family-domain-containing protein [Dimargaris cristalligena]|eukprot:RKP36972.1 FRG1-like family-domain-containing protein [Dimargaris cristalligena]